MIDHSKSFVEFLIIKVINSYTHRRSKSGAGVPSKDPAPKLVRLLTMTDGLWNLGAG